MMGFGGFGLLGGLGMGLGWLIWIVIIGLVIWAVVAFSGNGGSRQSESPIEILKRRYARGEISKAEFELSKQDLS
ncbi:MAG: SHOCT domain-containing protein [Chloroflexota bacterium]|nr:MAG: SHOCT domain-containing protein [Chloroflexota bacterium]